MFKRIFTSDHKEKKNLTDQNECTQMRIDLDYKGFHKSRTLQIKIDAHL